MMLWFPFKNSECKIDISADLAACQLTGDLPARMQKLHPKAIQIEWNTPPDGTEAAFTGFPLEARDPMTFRAHVASNRGPWSNQLTAEIAWIMAHCRASAVPPFSYPMERSSQLFCGMADLRLLGSH
jgi:hypothetical protein